MFEFYLASW